MTQQDNATQEKTLLIVGAGGFIGGFIARRALELGYNTWVGVRASTSRRYLNDPRLHFVVLDYDSQESVAATLAAQAPGGRWQYIIWNLGATKCANFMDFNRINYQYFTDFAEVLRRDGRLPDKLLYMSSLSALGPAEEDSGHPLDDTTIPQPNTRYGVSKIKSETYLDTHPDVPWIVFRPTGVYGPHEKDYLMMIKSIDAHWDFAVGYKRQMLTFIYVDDLVQAMFDAIAAPRPKGAAPQIYHQRRSLILAERIPPNCGTTSAPSCHHPHMPAHVGSVCRQCCCRENRCGSRQGLHAQSRQIQDYAPTQLDLRHHTGTTRLRI